MQIIKKNRWYATEEAFRFVCVRATPDDADDKETKPFFIVEIQDRKPDGSRVFTNEYMTASAGEVKALLGIKGREKLTFI